MPFNDTRSTAVISDNVRFAETDLNLKVINNYGDSLPTIYHSNEAAIGSVQITSQTVAPYLELEQHEADDPLTLNYADLGELLSNFNQLPTHMQQKVNAIADKQRLKPRDFLYDGYYPQTTLISLVEETISASVCLCGFKPSRAISSPGLCHKPRLCWKCATLDAKRSLKVFKPHFNLHSWDLLTISFHGDLAYSTRSWTEWPRYWNAAQWGLKELCRDHLFGGAITREEVKINSVAPIRALPHLHCVVSDSNLNDAALSELETLILQYRDDSGEAIELSPSIDLKPIRTEDDFYKVWLYIYKPTLFYEAYNAKWNTNDSPAVKRIVNRSVREAIEATMEIPFGRRQLNYVGSMRSGRHDFIGIKGTNRR